MNKSITIALDSMIFIYLFEDDPRYILRVKPLFEKIEIGDFKAATSIITPIEVLSAPNLRINTDKQLLFSRFFQNTPHLSIYDITWQIMEKAAELRRSNSALRTPDALQIATAIISGAKIFITNDLKLKRIDVSIKILLIDDFKML